VIVGEAAHIRAASPGGPRFDQGQDDAERHSIENAIWLCAACADLIDKNGGADHPVKKLLDWKRDAEARARDRVTGFQDLEASWSNNIAQLRYVNVPTLLSLAAVSGIEVNIDESLPGGWLNNQGLMLMRTLVACERVLDALKLKSTPLTTISDCDDDLTGMTLSFDERFFTKNGRNLDTSKSPPPVPADWRLATHVYTNIDKRKLVMVLDPRWITATTAFADFSSGRLRLAGLAILKRGHPEDEALIASPIVLGVPKSLIHDALFGPG
jgi:hypothetical protein